MECYAIFFSRLIFKGILILLMNTRIVEKVKKQAQVEVEDALQIKAYYNDNKEQQASSDIQQQLLESANTPPLSQEDDNLSNSNNRMNTVMDNEVGRDTAKHQASEAIAASNFWPLCWSLNQYIYFTSNYPWLFATDNNIGCTVCRDVSGTIGPHRSVGMKSQLVKEWTHDVISGYGSSKAAVQKSLRKKKL